MMNEARRHLNPRPWRSIGDTHPAASSGIYRLTPKFLPIVNRSTDTLPASLAAARIQLSRLGHLMFLCPDCQESQCQTVQYPQDTIFRIVIPPLSPDNGACQYSGGQSLGRCVVKLYTLCFLFLIF